MRPERLATLLVVLLLCGCDRASGTGDDAGGLTLPDGGLTYLCLIADDCPFGQECIDGVCGEPPDGGAPIGPGPCLTDGDCPDLRYACATSAEACVRVAGRCLDAVDCDPGLACDPTSHLCALPALDGGAPAPCRDGQARSCGTSKLGECRYGVEICQDGAFGSCTGAIEPTQELCDHLDNDCDGLTDEDFPLDRDPANCGECGRGCRFPHAQALCRNGLCEMGPCEPGWHDLDAAVPGCEYPCTPSNGGVEVCDGVDNDCDGSIDEGMDLDGDGFSSCGTAPGGGLDPLRADCDDRDPEVHPGAPERCNGKDDNCNRTIDEGFDQDGDGFTVCGTIAGGGTDPNRVDCDDRDPSIYPGAPERCNGKDDDCVNGIDDAIPPVSCPTGRPGICAAGHTVCSAGITTCVQDVPALPAEICGNGLDDDCTGGAPDTPGCGCTSGADNDHDGYDTCTDCDDTDGAIHPGAPELCNGKDDNCVNGVDEGFDQDGDGYTTCGTVPSGGLDPARVDCDDRDPGTHPGLACDCAPGCTFSPPSGLASPDGKDQNCNGVADESCNCSNLDQDGDGQTGCQGDCNDTDRTIYRGAPELCDGKDNDCNALTVANCDVGQTCTQGASGPDICKDRLICARDIKTGTSTCGSFCNFSFAGAGLGDGCRSGEACRAPLVLSENDHLCVPSTGAGTSATGDACKKDNQCRSNNCLTSGPSGWCIDQCGNDVDYCSPTTTCVIDFVPNTADPQYAYYTGWCFPNGTSLVGTLQVGAACTKGAATKCKWGDEACVGSPGHCSPPCCKHADCAPGYFCDANAIVREVPAYYEGSACSADAECGPGNTCDPATRLCHRNAGTAMPACMPRVTTGTRRAGDACTANADCASIFCERRRLGSVCVDPCCNDASCANGTTCEFVHVQHPTGQVIGMRACVHTPVPAPAPGDPELVWE